MTRCDYAACERRAKHHEDGWEFCTEHLRHHRALMHGGPFPAKAPSFPQSVFTQPCGTAAGARRHSRRGEPSCDLCREAATRLRNGYTSSTKTWHGVVAS
jgi:hypothetical protein